MKMKMINKNKNKFKKINNFYNLLIENINKINAKLKNFIIKKNSNIILIIKMVNKKLKNYVNNI